MTIENEIIFIPRPMEEEFLSKNDLETSISDAYQAIYLFYVRKYPEKESEYNTLLRIYHYDYRTTILSIEFENLKQERTALNGILNDE